MSFAGHAIDALKRIQYNRTIKQMHRARYNELKEAVSNINAKYHKFKDRSQLSEEELNIYKKKIRQKIKRERQKAFLFSLITTSIIIGIIYLASMFLYNYFFVK